MLHRNHPIDVAHAAATAAVLLEDRYFLGVGSGEPPQRASIREALAPGRRTARSD